MALILARTPGGKSIEEKRQLNFFGTSEPTDRGVQSEAGKTVENMDEDENFPDPATVRLWNPTAIRFCVYATASAN